MLRQRQKMESVGVLAAGVAHEVNNPLAFVRSNLSHARQIAEAVGSPDSDASAAKGSLCELWDVLDESVEGIDRISTIVDGLLRFSRLPTEGWQRIEVAEVIEEAIQLAAAKSLTRHGWPQGTAALERLAHTRNEQIRLRTAEAMAERKDPVFAPTLVRLLDDRRSIRLAALRGLSAMALCQEAAREGLSEAEQVEAWRRWAAAPNVTLR